MHEELKALLERADHEHLKIRALGRVVEDEHPYGVKAAYLVEHGVVIRERAEWVYDPNGVDWGIGAWICSKCGVKNENLGSYADLSPYRYAGSSFCPHCGRDMRRGKEPS